jgi:hypothetical protein
MFSRIVAYAASLALSILSVSRLRARLPFLLRRLPFMTSSQLLELERDLLL